MKAETKPARTYPDLRGGSWGGDHPPNMFHTNRSYALIACGAQFYNELIFSNDKFLQELPASIQAVFVIDDDCNDAYSGPKCELPALS